MHVEVQPYTVLLRQRPYHTEAATRLCVQSNCMSVVHIIFKLQPLQFWYSRLTDAVYAIVVYFAHSLTLGINTFGVNQFADRVYFMCENFVCTFFPPSSKYCNLRGRIWCLHTFHAVAPNTKYTPGQY